MLKKFTYHFFLFVALLSLSCQKDLPNQPKQNQSPTTRLWITSDSLLNETVSRQHLYFYGEDPDGYVVGFVIAFVKDSASNFTKIPNPDTLSYVWTTRNDTVIALPLLQKKDRFTIIVRAVDNRFSPHAISNGALIKGFPAPYWDRDSNGVRSAGDIEFPEMQQGIDPVGSIQLFPIKNTPPNVNFAVTPDENAFTIEQPDTTYTVATFAWSGNDDDGNSTITGYRIALNDSTAAADWTELRASDTLITLLVKRQESDIAGAEVEAELYSGYFNSDRMINTGKKLKHLRLNASNILYLQAKDIAGEYSARVRMPSTASKKWFVKKPKSNMLVIADFGDSPNGWRNNIIKYYRTIFADPVFLNDSLANFDVIERSSLPTYINPAFIKTLMLYRVVLWFTDINPSLTVAQIGLRSFTDYGGKAIFVTQFKDKNNPNYLYSDLVKYRDFLPLHPEKVMTDSVQYISNRLYVKDQKTGINTKIIPLKSGYPPLYADSLSTSGSSVAIQNVAFRKIFKNNDSEYLYKTDSSHTATPEFQGELEIACIDNQKSVVLFAMPLHLLNGWEHNLPLFFKQVIENEFGIK
ncbi:MAG: hypothetical protein WCW35_03030 [Bacteroidota bacterium]